MISPPLTGLIAAVYTPFDADGELRVSMIERQAQWLIESGASGVFVAGTTGESHSLSMDERIELARRWADVVSGTPLKLVIHVGHNSLPEAVVLARQAAQIGADAIAALAPSYFKPATVEQLIDFCEPLARAAGDTPFYYYDIPGMTGVVLPMARFLEQGKSRIPTLRGMKYSNGNLPQLQECLRLGEGEFDVLFGSDEALLAALALGGRGAVGATYNFAAPLYLRVIEAFEAGDWTTARREQARSVELVNLLYRYGFLPASKRLMAMLGIDCGQVRSPLPPLNPVQETELFQALQRLDMFGERLQLPIEKPSAKTVPAI
ncbi:MAG: dihydrodipicolinate synthase family protein [Planctomycetales bacterium]|nr:dihydrodipicolinate synthase family protein [Planctomycetales bacterium]